MRHPRTIALLFALLTLHGCVALTGQRLTWFCDPLTDTFYLLIQYDGIHEGKGMAKKGAEQIPQFIADGDIMFFDWFGHIARERLRKSKDDPNDAAAGAVRLLDLAKVEILGRYREPDGRIGAAQLVTIEKFKDFLKEVNRLINLGLRQQDRAKVVADAKKHGGMWRTAGRILTAARAGRTWIKARGHALQVTIPVQRDEWVAAKGTAALELVRNVMSELAKGGAKKSEVERLVRSLAATSFSYAETGDEVTFTLGDPMMPRTIHVQMHEGYNKELESVVAEHVRVDLDHRMVERILDQKDAASDAFRRARHWMPAEVEVAAMLSGVRSLGEVQDGASKARRTKLIEQLERFGARWNEDHGFPAAPDPERQTETDYLRSWRDWYAIRRRAQGTAAR